MTVIEIVENFMDESMAGVVRGIGTRAMVGQVGNGVPGMVCMKKVRKERGEVERKMV